MSYDTAPCEGRQASPSNPNQVRGTHAETVLSETFVFRCTVSEKADLRAKAEAASLPSSTLLREALGLVDAKRRKPIPRVDPKLTFAVSRIGGNLNQLAKWINRATISGHAGSIDAVKVAAQLVSIERQLAAIIDAHSDREAPQ